MAYFRNDFMKWHLSFIIPYVLTYIVGLLSESHSIARSLHPYLGMASVVIPLVVYLLLPNKRVVRQMIKSNFSMRCGKTMKVFRVATQVMMGYFLISVISGTLLYTGLYLDGWMASVLIICHHIGKVLVPLAVGTHVVSKYVMKRQQAKRTFEL